jgi:hypothetical protein
MGSKWHPSVRFELSKDDFRTFTIHMENNQKEQFITSSSYQRYCSFSLSLSLFLSLYLSITLSYCFTNVSDVIVLTLRRMKDAFSAAAAAAAAAEIKKKPSFGSFRK